jgi:hypothetical protein
MNITIPNGVTVHPMTRNVADYLQEAIGFENTQYFTFEVKDDNWVKTWGDSYSTKWSYRTLGRKSDYPYNDVYNDKWMDFEDNVQVCLVSTRTLKIPVGMILLWEHNYDTDGKFSCDTYLYILDKSTMREKNPSVKLRQEMLTTVGFNQKDDAGYAVARNTMVEDDLPNNFKQALAKFVRRREANHNDALKDHHAYIGHKKVRAGTPSSILTWSENNEIKKHRESAENKTDTAISKFNQTLKQLYRDHVYEGVATNASNISVESYLYRELFKNPDRMVNLFKDMEAREGTDLLKQITKAEEDVVDCHNFTLTHMVKLQMPKRAGWVEEFYQTGSSQGEVCGYYFHNMDNLDKDITRKIAVLNACMENRFTPYIVGVGFAYKTYTSELQMTFDKDNDNVIIYMLDGQDVEG